MNEVEVWRFHFKAIFPYLRISNAPPRCNRIERASKRARIGWRSRSCPAPILPPARPLTAVASMHASVTAAAFIITRKYPHPLRPPSSVLPSSPARLREKKGRVATNRRTTDADGRTDRGRIAARMRSAMPEGLHLFRFFPEGKQGRRRRRAADRGGAARAANSQLYPLGAGGLASGRGRAPSSDRSTPSKPWSKLLSVQ